MNTGAKERRASARGRTLGASLFLLTFFWRLKKKVSRRKGETLGGRCRRNGYVLSQKEPHHLTKSLREQACSHRYLSVSNAKSADQLFELHDLCKKYNVPFFINDNVDIAIRCHAEGIHVGQEDMAAAQVRQRVGDEMMIGVSVHSVEEALEAVRHGADCLGVGAAFSTHTKADVDVLPEGMMKAICDAVDIPVVAIGGIHKENLLRLKGTGVNGVALVSAIFGAEDIEAECRELKALAEQL